MQRLTPVKRALLLNAETANRDMNAMRRRILVILGLLGIRFIWATIFSAWAPLKASGFFELLRQPILPHPFAAPAANGQKFLHHQSFLNTLLARLSRVIKINVW
jgi:hypothetical protein